MYYLSSKFQPDEKFSYSWQYQIGVDGIMQCEILSQSSKAEKQWNVNNCISQYEMTHDSPLQKLTPCQGILTSESRKPGNEKYKTLKFKSSKYDTYAIYFYYSHTFKLSNTI